MQECRNNNLKMLAGGDITCEFSYYFDNFEKPDDLSFLVIHFNDKILSELHENLYIVT